MTQPRPGGSAAGCVVVLWGTCDLGKPRVRLLLQGLRECGVEVLECRADLWRGIEDKSQVRGPVAWLRLALRALRVYPVLVVRYLRLPRHDWVLLGYPAIPDIFVIRLFAWIRGARIAFDWFLSAYDTIVLDRRLVGPRHPLAWLVRGVEWLGVRLADRPFMDTRTHARRMESLYGLRAGRCGHVMVGAEDAFFLAASQGDHAPAPDGELRVLFYGQFIPLHGIGTLVQAARLLRDAPVVWTLVGRGQEAPRIRALLDAQPLPALRWLDWVDYADLPHLVASADVCLGIFGTSDKAASVVPNKVFQVLAAGRPLVTRDSPAIRELSDPIPDDIALVPPGDARALADALLRWQRQLPACKGGPDASRVRIGAPAVGRQCLDMLEAPGA